MGPYRASVLPARAAYSHSASVGSRPPAQPQNAVASSQLTFTMGMSWLFQPALKSGAARHLRPCAPGKPPVRRHRHFRLAHPETLRDRHLVRRFLVIVTFAVPRRAAHHERSRRNPDVLEPVFRVLFHCSGNGRGDAQPGRLYWRLGLWRFDFRQCCLNRALLSCRYPDGFSVFLFSTRTNSQFVRAGGHFGDS